MPLAATALAQPALAMPKAAPVAEFPPTLAPTEAAAAQAFGPPAAAEPYGRPLAHTPAAWLDDRRALAEPPAPIELPRREREGVARGLLIGIGVALLAAFAVPWSLGDGGVVFAWDVIAAHDVPAARALAPLGVGASGLLALAIAALPLGGRVRAALAVVLGLAPIALTADLAGLDSPRAAAAVLGLAAVLVGLVLRARRPSLAARLLVTVGAGALLALTLIPEGGTSPLVATLRALPDRPLDAGRALLGPALLLLALGAWLPGAVSAPPLALAWALALLPHANALIDLPPGAIAASPGPLVAMPVAFGLWALVAAHGAAGVLDRGARGIG